MSTTVISILYPAKCKDCRACSSYPKGKTKRHYCVNSKSKQNGLNVTLKQLACDK